MFRRRRAGHEGEATRVVEAAVLVLPTTSTPVQTNAVVAGLTTFGTIGAARLLLTTFDLPRLAGPASGAASLLGLCSILFLRPGHAWWLCDGREHFVVARALRKELPFGAKICVASNVASLTGREGRSTCDVRDSVRTAVRGRKACCCLCAVVVLETETEDDRSNALQVVLQNFAEFDVLVVSDKGAGVVNGVSASPLCSSALGPWSIQGGQLCLDCSGPQVDLAGPTRDGLVVKSHARGRERVHLFIQSGDGTGA